MKHPHMITQRDLDIWRVEAQVLTRRLFEEWRRSYLGRRGGENVPGRPGQEPPIPKPNY